MQHDLIFTVNGEVHARTCADDLTAPPTCTDDLTASHTCSDVLFVISLEIRLNTMIPVLIILVYIQFLL